MLFEAGSRPGQTEELNNIWSRQFHLFLRNHSVSSAGMEMNSARQITFHVIQDIDMALEMKQRHTEPSQDERQILGQEQEDRNPNEARRFQILDFYSKRKNILQIFKAPNYFLFSHFAQCVNPKFRKCFFLHFLSNFHEILFWIKHPNNEL